jgi:hypothetical protein
MGTHKHYKNKKYKGGNKYSIIVHLTGGLGNRLFSILAGYGCAEKWNMNVYISNKHMESGTMGNHVSNSQSISDIQKIIPSIKYIDDSINTSEWVVVSEPPNWGDLTNPNTNCILHGYLQHEKYFPSNVNELIKLYEPLNNVVKNIDISHLYFIHFRFGDFGETSDKLLSYYTEASNKILDKDSNAKFIIISDDIEKAKNYIKMKLSKLLNTTLNYDNNDNRLDGLYYFAICAGGICSYSTYCRIGAYMIPKKNKDMLFFPNTKGVSSPDWATILNTELTGGYKKIIHNNSFFNCINFITIIEFPFTIKITNSF